MTRLLRVAGVFVILMAGSAAGAATFTGEPSGAAEDPPNESPGTGTAEVELDPEANLLRIDVTFSDLQSPTTIAHIHCCAPPGESAGVATTLPTFPGFPAGVMSGSYQESFDTSDESTWNAAFVQANGGTTEGAEAALLAGLESGMAYFNIHTMMFGAGEIRADLGGGGGEPTATSEPTSPTGPTETPLPTETVPLVTPTITGTPAGTATATVTPDGTVTPTGEVTGTPTGDLTGTPTTSVTTTTRTATAMPTDGTPSVTGTPVGTITPSPPVTVTGSPGRTTTPPRTATSGPRAADDDSCHVVAADRTGTAWLLLIPAALLLVARRRRS